MDDLPAGATFGSLVHAVLGARRPRSRPTSQAELRRADRRSSAAGGRSTATTAELAQSLLPMQRTSLGPLAGGRTLRRHRHWPTGCRELDFELPLAGGDRAPTADVPLAAMAAVLRRHLPAGDPMRCLRRASGVPGARRSSRWAAS